MTLLAHTLLFLHLLGMAVLVGAFSTQLSSAVKRVTPGQWHGALLALLSGLALVVLHGAMPSPENPLQPIKITVKLVLALLIALFAFQGRGRAGWTAGWLRVGLLSIANTAVAVFA